MRVFLAGALGVIGRPLAQLLVKAGHAVTGTTRSAAREAELRGLGLVPAIVDAFDAGALRDAVVATRPDVVIHQLTDLPDVLDPAAMSAALERNARLRIEGTRNLVAAARAAGARRIVAQSIAFVYEPGNEPHGEDDPLEGVARGEASVSVGGVLALESQVLTSGLDGVVLRYGRLYGPGTWTDRPGGPAPLHVDAAAHAALLALDHGRAGLYNIAEDDGYASIAKARRDLGFDPTFRIGTTLT